MIIGVSSFAACACCVGSTRVAVAPAMKASVTEPRKTARFMDVLPNVGLLVRKANPRPPRDTRPNLADINCRHHKRVSGLSRGVRGCRWTDDRAGASG